MSIALSFSLFSFVTVDSFGVVVFVIRQMADLTNTPTPQAVINTNVVRKFSLDNCVIKNEDNLLFDFNNYSK